MTTVKIMVVASVVMTTKWMEQTSNKLQGAVWVQSALRDQCTGWEIPMKFQMLCDNRD